MRRKKPLTITLHPDIIEKVDAEIDGTLIRNRSQAIEALINEGFRKNVETAVILAGGAVAAQTNPALKKINGQYLLDIMIDQLKQFGFKKIILCIRAGSRQIQNIFGNGSDRGVKIDYVYEAQPMGSAGVLLATKKKIAETNFLVLYGDILTNINLKNFIDFHFSENGVATMGIKPRMGEKKYAQVMIQGNTVVNYSAKETNDRLGLVNAGLYIFSKKIFEYIKKGKPMNLDEDLIPLLIKRTELSAFVFQGIWYDISAPSDFVEAVAKWQ